MADEIKDKGLAVVEQKVVAPRYPIAREVVGKAREMVGEHLAGAEGAARTMLAGVGLELEHLGQLVEDEQLYPQYTPIREALENHFGEHVRALRESGDVTSERYAHNMGLMGPTLAQRAVIEVNRGGLYKWEVVLLGLGKVPERLPMRTDDDQIVIGENGQVWRAADCVAYDNVGGMYVDWAVYDFLKRAVVEGARS